MPSDPQISRDAIASLFELDERQLLSLVATGSSQYAGLVLAPSERPALGQQILDDLP
jgi:hypothetical protein